MDTSTQLNDEQRWDAVRARDSSRDGEFFYAVRTTGIYCRPSCPSRLSRRSNTEFFCTAAEAEEAGYRACKRCRPAAGESDDPRTRIVRDICARLDRAPAAPNIEALAAEAGLSSSHLRREFKRHTGLTPREYAAGKRREMLQRELSSGTPVSEAIYEAGYGSGSRVYEKTSRTLGMTPAEYRNGARQITIAFAVAESELGLVLVARTEKGICCIELGDDETELAGCLSRRFPAATLTQDTGALADTLQRLTRFVATPAAGLHLPLDIQGTAFQRRVWEALQTIPPGRTATYGEIAAAIGSPKAHRAVARACAENRLAVAIPCHRVVRSDGGLGGYRWGLDRKRRLLARERATGSDTD